MPDPEFLLLGDGLWLELVNTIGTLARPETLPDPAAYLRWTKAVRLPSPAAAKDFEEVLRFREQLLRLARALDGSRNPPAAVVAAINAQLSGWDGQEQLVRAGGSWRLEFAPARPPSGLEAIARSAAAALANPLAVVRACANPECGLFLLDESPNQGRRWCSPSRCGLRGRTERRRRTRLTPLVAER